MSSEADKYDVLEKIGHGSFGIIRKVRRKNDGMVLCRKEISYLKMSQKEREQLHAEFQILSTLSHPNIVKYFHREHLKQSQDLHFYMEYCGNGDLGRVIRDLSQKNQYAEESFVWSIFAQLVTALYRCHYGVDPPEVGKTILGLGQTAKPKAPTGGMTILHRDLKPENVFLGEDNSVKLGDFGLSKMIQSHDFASTYVGTPFYMSPEICAAEKYTLKSDIWSLGCIIYELCSREPPFNAKSHFQLVQRIKEGKIAPLPAIYSAELMSVIKDCLKVNPDRRPDTAQLLNLPVVRLMRKEKEVVEFSRVLKTKEDSLDKRLRELDQKLTAVDQDKVYMRQEIDSSLRREWEVKARLEIDRLVQQEIENLQAKFEEEVSGEVVRRVEAELQKYTLKKTVSIIENEVSEFSASLANHGSHNNNPTPFSSIGNSTTASGSADGDFPSTTDLTELSAYDSPEPMPMVMQEHFLKKKTRTPFGRAQTMFAAPAAHLGTPMDIEMASPSPITIASLSLSPRRNVGAKPPATHTGNIFAANSNNQHAIADLSRWETTRTSSSEMVLSDSDSDSDDDEEANAAPASPTRMIKRSIKNPFQTKANSLGNNNNNSSNTNLNNNRPGLPHAQKSAPIHHRLQRTQTLGLPTMASNPDLRRQMTAAATGINGVLRERANSPNRRLSRIPSVNNLNLNGNNTGSAIPNPNSNSSGSNSDGGCTGSGGGLGNLSRAPSIKAVRSESDQQSAGLPSKVGMVKPSKMLHQHHGHQNNGVRGRTLVELQQARAGGRPLSLVMGNAGGGLVADRENGGGMPVSPTKRTAAFRDHVMAAARGSGGGSMPDQQPAAVWDPERDDMPSPFLVRRKNVAVSR